MTVRLITGDCRTVLASLPADSVHCCVTSPPYWGLRDYGTAKWEGGDPDCDHKNGALVSPKSGLRNDGRDHVGPYEGEKNVIAGMPFKAACAKCGARRIDSQIGLEPTFTEFIDKMVEVFREVRRVLRPDGTLWLNLGDSYATGAGKVGEHPGGGDQGSKWSGRPAAGATTRVGTSSKRAAMGKHQYIGDRISIGPMSQPNRMPQLGLKPKDLVGMPWRVALALQADGWWLRQDIIWSKPNPMPESVTDRCTKAHEYLFLLSKSARYYFDADAISEAVSPSTHARISQDLANQVGTFRANGGAKTNGPLKAVVKGSTRKLAEAGRGIKNNDSMDTALAIMPDKRNKRSVWTVATQPFSEAHFATFPPALIEPAILAGCPPGGTVLDTFGGAGTTGLVADRLQRNAILIELNHDYVAMAQRRLAGDAPLLAQIQAAE